MPLGCHSDPLPGASLAEEMEELAQMEATEATTEAGTGLCGYPLRRVDDLVWGFYQHLYLVVEVLEAHHLDKVPMDGGGLGVAGRSGWSLGDDNYISGWWFGT